jgi:hypothetical protein
MRALSNATSFDLDLPDEVPGFSMTLLITNQLSNMSLFAHHPEVSCTNEVCLPHRVPARHLNPGLLPTARKRTNTAKVASITRISQEVQRRKPTPICLNFVPLQLP